MSRTGKWYVMISNDLHRDPTVVSMAIELNVHEDTVVGRLVKIWAWFSGNTEDGRAFGVSFEALERMTGLPGFPQLMEKNGWLKEWKDDNGRPILAIPEWDRWFGDLQARRESDRKRKATYRAGQGNQPKSANDQPKPVGNPPNGKRIEKRIEKRTDCPDNVPDIVPDIVPDKRGTRRGDVSRTKKGQSTVEGEGEEEGKEEGKGRKRARNKKVSIAAQSHPDAKPGDPRGFPEFWHVVHRKEGRQYAVKAFPRAVDRVRQANDWDHDRAVDFICDRMVVWKASPAARDEVKGQIHPTTWLNGGRYDDDPATWESGGNPFEAGSEAHVAREAEDKKANTNKRKAKAKAASIEAKKRSAKVQAEQLHSLAAAAAARGDRGESTRLYNEAQALLGLEPSPVPPDDTDNRTNTA